MIEFIKKIGDKICLILQVYLAVEQSEHDLQRHGLGSLLLQDVRLDWLLFGPVMQLIKWNAASSGANLLSRRDPRLF